jgi:predicted MPP superfamily phosphohydrolase
MKVPAIIVFVSIVSVIYFSGGYYIYNRLIQHLPSGLFKTIAAWSFWLLTASFLIAQFLERTHPNEFKHALSAISASWLAILLYLLLFFVAFDIVRLANHWLHFIPETWKLQWLTPQKVFVYAMEASGLLVIGGLINAANPRVKQVDIHINKASKYPSLKAALVTDIHMGAIIGKNRLTKMVNKLNHENPDLILFAGDLVDHNPIPVKEKELGKYFLQLKPRLGMYASTGNHEYIGNAESSIDYLENYGINYLRDTAQMVDNGLVIVGREDMQINRLSGNKRKPMESIVPEKHHLPIILIDHQPVEYRKAQKQGVDLMVSGHTHKGQLWPFNYITKRVFENHYGLMQKGGSWFYTSSGYGTWGPPVRIGNRPEIVIFNITFDPL